MGPLEPLGYPEQIAGELERLESSLSARKGDPRLQAVASDVSSLRAMLTMSPIGITADMTVVALGEIGQLLNGIEHYREALIRAASLARRWREEPQS